MRLRLSWTFGLLLASFVARPAFADPGDPTVVLRFKSIDGMLADAKYVLGLAGQEEVGKQLGDLIDSQAGPKGLVGSGLDTKRPFGLYLNVGAAGVDSTGAILIPVADQKAFVAFVGEQLESKNIAMKKGDDGVYTISSNAAPVSAFVTFADGYAYVTVMDKDPIGQGKRLSPAKLFPEGDAALFGLTARLEAVPDLLKQLGFGLLENRLADVKEAKGNESEAVAKKKATLIDSVSETLKSWIDQASTINLSFTVDRKSEELSFDGSLTGKMGTDLAAAIADLTKPTSRALGGNLAGQFGINIAIPEKVRGPLAAYVTAAFNDAMSKEKDVVKKALLRKAYEAVTPTVNAGKISLSAGMIGPNASGKYSLLAGVGLSEEKKIEGFVKELYPSVPEPVRSKLKLDATTVAGTPVHVVDAPDDMTPDLKRVFGNKATVQVAFPKDAMLVAVGGDAGDVLKKALTSTESRPAPPIMAQGSLTKLAPLNKDNAEVAVKAAQKVFGNAGSGSDVVTMSVKGGDALRMKLSMKGLALKYAGMLDEK